MRNWLQAVEFSLLRGTACKDAAIKTLNFGLTMHLWACIGCLSEILGEVL